MLDSLGVKHIVTWDVSTDGGFIRDIQNHS